MDNSTPKTGQKFCQRNAMQTLGDFTLDYIVHTYQPLKHGQEFLARIACVTPATVINWFRRRCKPQTDTIGEMIINDPAFRRQVLEWIERNCGECLDN